MCPFANNNDPFDQTPFSSFLFECRSERLNNSATCNSTHHRPTTPRNCQVLWVLCAESERKILLIGLVRNDTKRHGDSFVREKLCTCAMFRRIFVSTRLFLFGILWEIEIATHFLRTTKLKRNIAQVHNEITMCPKCAKYSAYYGGRKAS